MRIAVHAWKISVVLAGLVGAQAALAQVLQTRPSAQASSQSPTQTPRQAVIEILRSKDESAVMRHLPEATKKKMKEFGPASGAGFDIPSTLGAGALITAQAEKNGSKVDIEEAGPVLMTVEDPKTKQKFEVTVDNDDLAGDEDDMQLGFRMSKEGEDDLAHWFTPKILLHMKQEQGIWRIEEIGVSAKAPIGDPEFLDAWARSMKKSQQEAAERAPTWMLPMFGGLENRYHKQHGAYTCSLKELDNSMPESPAAATTEVDMLKRDGYDVRLSGCGTSSYLVVAVPMSGTGKAFCMNESGRVRFARDGKAETCVQNGEEVPNSFTVNQN